MWLNQDQYQWMNGARVYIDDDDGIGPIMHIAPGMSNGGGTYHWSGRQALDHPHSIVLQAYDTGWYARATGFQLLLP